MAKINYVSGENKIVAQFNGSLDFQLLNYYQGSIDIMYLFQGRGSIGLTDLSQDGFNKVHLGSATKNPHVESSHQEGLRIDLADFDLFYALERAKELEQWRSPSYRTELAEWYAKQNYPFRDRRLKQLGISPEGLEAKIFEAQGRVSNLRQFPDSTYISERAKAIEQLFFVMLDLMKEKSTKQIPFAKKPKPNIVEALDVVEVTQQIYSLSRDILSFIKLNISVEQIVQATNYWNRVALWGDL